MGTKVVRYVFVIQVPLVGNPLHPKFIGAGEVDVMFRPQTIRTNINEHDCIAIDKLEIGSVNQLMIDVDVATWGTENIKRIQDSALDELGLLGKPFEQIDEYLDRHNMDLPDPGRIDLPTMRPMTRVWIAGRVLKQPKETSLIFMMRGASIES